MRLVIALGGNVLLRRDERPDAAVQLSHIVDVAHALADLADVHDMLIVHGNGPQVGLLALESASDGSLAGSYPLGDLVAETQGLIGGWLQRVVAPLSQRPMATVVTQTIVSPDDPAFRAPSKFVGPRYDERTADALGARHGWVFGLDGGRPRRVVASPEPVDVVELPIAQLLLASGVTVVLGGGGGVPVARVGGAWQAQEAVVDKDLVAAQIAGRLDADLLVILTDVPAVMRNFGTDAEAPIPEICVDDLGGLAFPDGSMGPKVRAVTRFVRETHRRAAIGDLRDATAVVAGSAGTQVHPCNTSGRR